VFVAGDEMLTGLGEDGLVRWSLPMPGGFSAPLLWHTGWLAVPASNGDLLGIRARDGHVIWTARLGSRVRARPTIDGDRVFAPLEDGRLAALDLADGRALWERPVGEIPGAVLAIGDRLFVGTREKAFYFLECLAREDGDRKWRWRTGGAVLGPPISDGERVYVTALDNVLRALNLSNGWQQWKQGLPLRPSGGALLIGRLLVVAGVGADVRLYRVENGELAGTFGAPTEVAAPPLVLPHEVEALTGVVILTRDGELQVLRRRIEPAIVPLDYPLGVPVPLIAPPAAPRPQASSSSWMVSARRRTPSSIRSGVGAENDSRSMWPPLPSTKNALPTT
jgi:outer membrane protein assembly factor BamB